MDAGQVFLFNAPASFDAAPFEVWGALLNGARLAIMPPGRRSLAELAGAIRRHGVTTLWLTAGLFNLMIEEQPAALRGLTQLLAGGEALSVSHVRKALEALPECRLINGYGPTETPPFPSCHPTVATDGPYPIPIGRPLANTTAHLLDERRRPVPVGVAGELYLGGDGLARGYLNDP